MRALAGETTPRRPLRLVKAEALFIYREGRPSHNSGCCLTQAQASLLRVGRSTALTSITPISYEAERVSVRQHRA